MEGSYVFIQVLSANTLPFYLVCPTLHITHRFNKRSSICLGLFLVILAGIFYCGTSLFMKMISKDFLIQLLNICTTLFNSTLRY